MKARSVVSGRGGKVDYKNLWRDQQEAGKRIRWRTLRLRLDSVPVDQVPTPFPSDRRISTDIKGSVGRVGDALLVHIFGYACYEGGPWFGYTKEMLKDAPCAHCGQDNVFGGSSWAHDCPGWHNGKQLPCEDDHPCKGEPSMATAPMWRSSDWIEMPLGSVK